MADAGRSRRLRTTADGSCGRCLSDLSDDLLRHILFLAPDKEGASTAVLSRRWRWLWRTSGAVYLDSRFFTNGCSSPDQERESFLRGAEHALAAAGRIRRLTISIAEDSQMELLTLRVDRSEDNLMETLVTIPAARRVEELQIDVKSGTLCVLSFGSLPSEAIRVLRITRCVPLTAAPPHAAFLMLVELHLEGCGVSFEDFQSMINASPRLSTLHLVWFSLFKETNDDQLVGRLVLPAVSALVLTDCSYDNLELDAPRLQYFRYKGYGEDTNRHRLSLKPQASSNMVHVDLDITPGNNKYIYGPTPTRELFWRFIQKFNTTKVLKLTIHNITMDDLALIDKASYDQLLGGFSFSLLEQLELEAEYKHGEASMAMLANLLQCCRVVRDIRIKLAKQDESPSIESSIINKQAALHFDKSVSSFRNRRRRPIDSLGQQNDVNYEALDIPGLNGEHSFNCLQSHIKRVSLQFSMDDQNCLGVKLAKFFSKNAMVLQELHIDDGSHEMLEHLNSIVRTKMDC